MPERSGTDCMSQTETLGFDDRLLGMNSFQSGQPHVAQQSRRDRLRYQPVPVPEAPSTHFADMPHHSDPTIPGPIHVVDCQAMYSPGLMIDDFSTGAQTGTSVSSLSQNPNLCSNLLFAAATQVGNNVQNSSLWKSSHSTDWSTMNCGYQDLSISSSMNNSSNAVISTQQGQSQFGEILPLGPSATPHQGGLELESFDRHNNNIPWIGGGSSNELALLPSYSSPSSRISSSAVWMPRQTQQQWSSSSCEGDSSARGLSLSLSSKLPPDPPLVPYEAKFGSEAYPLNSIPSGVVRDLQNPNPCMSSYKNSNNLTSSSRCLLMQSVVGLPSTDNHRGVGPLGPFTGYATILRNSKFLKPAQQLLVESCSQVTGTLVLVDPPEKCRMPSAYHSKAESHKSTAADDVKCGGNSDTSSFSMHSSNGPSCQGTGDCVGGDQFRNPQIQQKKAKLLFMQGEVCRRQKHYNQQMQMAMSSFESVAGLSAAMPFLSLALKSIVRHFRFLKSVISEQLLDTRRVLGEEFMSSPSYSKAETAVASGLKFFDQTIRKQIEEANGLGLLEHGQPVWRPQRGLPERAVAVLRAWLFDHFLHPYPTDTDKHMLATQTGLSRNQVSNWFINARVRVWKPMVEEIHMLETKGLADVDLNSSKNDITLASGAIESGRSRSTSAMIQQEHHHDQKLSDCSNGDCLNMGHWHPEKRIRMEHFDNTEGRDGGITGFSTYPTGFDMSELGGVSLTLGLRHEEGTHHQQQIRSYFGNQLVQEFVG